MAHDDLRVNSLMVTKSTRRKRMDFLEERKGRHGPGLAVKSGWPRGRRAGVNVLPRRPNINTVSGPLLLDH